MSREVTVTYTVRYTAQLEVPDEQTVAEAIQNIDIPETPTSQYNGDSFDVIEVFEKGKRVPESQW